MVGIHFAVPGDGLDEASLPLDCRGPAEGGESGFVDAVAHIVDIAIRNELDKGVFRTRGGEAELADDLPRHFGDADLELCAYIVDLFFGAAVKDEVEGARDVFDVDVAAKGLACAVEAALFATEEAENELGQNLLRKLIGSIDIVAARDDDGKVVRVHVGLADELGTGLGASVRVGGLEGRRLSGPLAKDIAIHLISGHMDEAFDVELLGALEECVSAKDVGLCG